MALPRTCLASMRLPPHLGVCALHEQLCVHVSLAAASGTKGLRSETQVFSWLLVFSCSFLYPFLEGSEKKEKKEHVVDIHAALDGASGYVQCREQIHSRGGACHLL